MSELPPYAFVDLKAESFPFHVELIDPESKAVVWETWVQKAGAMWVPGRKETNAGRPVNVRLTFPDGEVVEMGS
jgi:hypothetical protein